MFEIADEGGARVRGEIGNRTGRLFVFEGIDGSGKTTQLRRVAEALRARGHGVVELFEPTNGPHGSRIRASVRGQAAPLAPEEELDLFVRDRHENIAQNITPALGRGEIVLLDRYYFSSVAYQGARGLDPATILKRNEAFAPRPDLVFYFKIEIEAALERIRRARGGVTDDFERADFLERVKAIFDWLARTVAEFRVIDATKDPAEVTRDVVEAVEAFLRTGERPSICD